MSISRRIFLFFTLLTMRIVVFTACSLLALVLLFSNPEAIKNALVNADAYNRASDTTLNQLETQSDTAANGFPIDDPQIQQIAKNSFSTQLLLGETEQALDDVYAWLRGDVQALEFEINFAQAKDTFARQVADYATNRLSSLPVCTSIPSSQNVFEIQCLPAGIDLAEIRLEVYQSILTDPGFLQDAVIGPDNLPATATGQSVTEAYKDVPQYYAWITRAPYLLMLLALLLAVVVVLMSRTRYQGLRTIASTLIITGIILAISPLIANYITPSLNQSIQDAITSENGYGPIINDVSNALYADLNAMLINIAIIVASLGLIVGIMTRSVQHRKNIYADIDRRSGLATSLNKVPSTTKGIQQSSVPIQSSEHHYKSRKPSKSQKKYRKL